ncbi:RRXRR domain-containing protein, partial [Coleofasciculus sp. E1-EBD-02]|uniref:RRXRR domain-containing protein n=1 Tax=Coleofasciculus sp. E1-EBD-02 TaxID=3068481 RepID=UPI0032F62669
MSNYVFLIDANRTPMNPIHPAQARKLMEAGKAAVLRRYPDKAHWLDAACVGVTEMLTVLTNKILQVKATGQGGRQRCQTDRLGYPH